MDSKLLMSEWEKVTTNNGGIAQGWYFWEGDYVLKKFWDMVEAWFISECEGGMRYFEAWVVLVDSDFIIESEKLPKVWEVAKFQVKALHWTKWRSKLGLICTSSPFRKENRVHAENPTHY